MHVRENPRAGDGMGALSLVVALVLLAPEAPAQVTFNWAAIGDAGNAPNGDLGDGSVATEYRIATTEVTNTQFASFLNAVAKTDTHDLYNPFMSSVSGGITRSGQDGAFTYSVTPGREGHPVTYTSQFDAMRFINWLHNGQGDGATESGVYEFGSQRLATRAEDARYFLPTRAEWYKAAYYQRADQGGDLDNYWLYPTSSNDLPIAGVDANFSNVLGDTTPVGMFAPNVNGIFDLAGNALEMLESSVPILLGGSFRDGEEFLRPDAEWYIPPSAELSWVGFRVASPIPAPGTASLLAIGCTLGTLRRSRTRPTPSYRRSVARLAAAAAIGQVALAPTTAIGAPVITDLGTVAGYGAMSHPMVSANGLVVAGTVERNNFGLLEKRAVRWTAGGGAVSLGLPAGELEDSWSDARGLSADGSVIVGNVDEDQGFLWSVSSGFEAVLGIVQLGGVDAAGTTAVGTKTTGSLQYPEFRAVLIDENGSITRDMGNAFGTSISGNGTSAAGVNLGGGAPQFNTAFRSTGPGAFELLGRLPGQDYSAPNAVNADGSVIVGRSGFGNIDYAAAPAHAFRWSTSDGLQDLGVLPGSNRSDAFAVNGDGTLIVGESRDWMAAEFPRAFLWSDDSGMLDLNEYLPTIGFNLDGWLLTSATGISADGSVIVGEGWFNGSAASWIVSGVPAPGALSVFGVVGLLGARRRRGEFTLFSQESSAS